MATSLDGFLTFYETTVPETVYRATWERLFSKGDFEPRGLMALFTRRGVPR